LQLNKNMSHIELILLSILRLNKKTDSISVEDIVVDAWEKSPDRFSLGKYNYPDSSAIRKRLYTDMQPLGLCRISKTGMVHITKHGLEYANNIQKKKDTKTYKTLLTKAEKEELNRIVNLKGFTLFNDNNEAKLIDIDAYEFYNISVRTSQLEIKKKKRQLDSTLTKAEKLSFKRVGLIKEYKHFVDEILKDLIDEHNSAKN
jgi:hypothetical protein